MHISLSYLGLNNIAFAFIFYARLCGVEVDNGRERFVFCESCCWGKGVGFVKLRSTEYISCVLFESYESMA